MPYYNKHVSTNDNVQKGTFKYKAIFNSIKVSTDGTKILTRSTIAAEETTKWEDGNEYPLYKLEISSQSHPFYTGKQNLIDTAGRIDKFMKRYNKK